jgi:UDP-arabinose 4-epimerase
MHFAARAYVGESVEKPAEYYDVNVRGTLALLDAMREAGTPNLVFSSSCATYGVPDSIPIRETDPQRPVNPYGWTKLLGERAIADYAQAYGLHFAVLRYFNAAGADSEGELLERHSPETHLIPLTLMAATGNGPPLKVFGTNYATPDGTAVRDYVHVSDLALAHLAALRHLMQRNSSIALNLGTGTGYSVREIIAAVERKSGKAVPWIAAPPRVGDPPSLIADGSAARKTLGFQPRYSDLDTIVSTALQGVQALDQITKRSRDS